MENYIKNIKVKRIFHLRDFEINIGNASSPHLFITGKNGSGKTILLNAIGEYLDKIRNDKSLNFTKNQEHIAVYESLLKDSRNELQRHQYQNSLDGLNKIEKCTKAELVFGNIVNVSDSYHKGDFVFAFYVADRKPDMKEPKNPEKPILNKPRMIKEGLTSQFIKFLVDLKIQEALARNETQINDADNIGAWFDNFEKLLGEIYSDTNLKIVFNYKDYSFRIQTDNKLFRFTELSDGFAAIMDIMSDLILKMQSPDSLVRAYEKRGIVLIDEVENHLHLALQKNIMPILTKVFPNIQFIVTTHSPFVLNSLDNAVAYDLEHNKMLTELNEYSYEALAEGYFKVDTQSSYTVAQLNRLKELLQKEELSVSEKIEIKKLIEDLNNIPEALEPNAVGELIDLKIKYNNVISAL